nr:sigma 54-interacting transcriptional regulator [uncultured Desulfobacter sp.]
MVVDCAALPGHLVESILFGHTRAAFTGADADRTELLNMVCGNALRKLDSGYGFDLGRSAIVDGKTVPSELPAAIIDVADTRIAAVLDILHACSRPGRRLLKIQRKICSINYFRAPKFCRLLLVEFAYGILHSPDNPAAVQKLSNSGNIC